MANDESRPVAPRTTEIADDSHDVDLVELLYRLLAGWRLILSLALAGAIAALVWTVAFVTPMYKATSTIYVLNRNDSAINMSDLQIGAALTKDYVRVFNMWEVHEEVIANLNLPYSYAQMSDMLSVANYSDTRMLDITVTSPSAEEAALIANEYASVARGYIAETMSTEKPNIMSVARVPSGPVSPNKTRNVMTGFLLGAMLACGCLYLRFYLDDKIKTVEDVRRYAGLATLAVVPIESSVSNKANKAPGKASKAQQKSRGVGRKA